MIDKGETGTAGTDAKWRTGIRVLVLRWMRHSDTFHIRMPHFPIRTGQAAKC